MTRDEMQTSLKFGLDKLDSLNYANLEEEELDLLLNQAQDRFIKQRYGINNVKRQSFEETQKRTEDLKNIVENSVLTGASIAANNSTNIDSNARFVTLPTNLLFIIQERCGISYTDTQGLPVTNERVSVKAIEHDDFDTIINDPFNKPDNSLIMRLMAKSKVELISSTGVTIVNYYLRYIRTPLPISDTQDCELSAYTHQELVDIAIDIALEAIESQRGKTFDKILNTNE